MFQANNMPCHRLFHVHLRRRSSINELRLLNLSMEGYDGVGAGEERAIVVIIQLTQTTWGQGMETEHQIARLHPFMKNFHHR